MSQSDEDFVIEDRQKTAVEKDINLDRDDIGLEAATSIVIEEVEYQDKQSEEEHSITEAIGNIT